MRSLILPAALCLVALLGQTPPKADAQDPRHYGGQPYYYTPGYATGQAYGNYPYGVSYGYYQPGSSAYYQPSYGYHQQSYDRYGAYGYRTSPSWNGYRSGYAPGSYYRGGGYAMPPWGGGYRR
jgi:hypothetical protein